MRRSTIVQSAGYALAAAILLVACGGGGGNGPVPTITTEPVRASPIAAPSSALAAPTPVVPASPIAVPTASVTSTPITGLPSASP